MAIADDFTIYPATKVIRHTSGTTVYSAIAFYSYLMDTFDEPGYLTYETPIKFNTPTSFTMLNGWFLDDGDGDGTATVGNILKYITGGGIDTSGYTTVSDPIWMMDLDRSAGANFVFGDLDVIIRNTDDAANIGPLLAFKVGYPSGNLTRMWVRNTNSATIPDSADGIEATTGGGTGDYTDNTLGPAVNGDEIYHNLFTIAAFAGSPDPQVYVYQNHPVDASRVRIAEWSAYTNWDRGSIDILVPVKLGGTLVDSGDITTFARQTGDSFTFVESTLNTSGRTPIATETSADEVNVTEGEHYLLYDGSDTGSFTAGDVITDADLSAAETPTWYAEVVSVTEFTSTTAGVLELRGLRGTITDGETIYVSDVSEGTTNGTPGGTYFTASAISVQLGVGLTVTGGDSNAKRVIKGVNAVASDYHYVSAVDEAITGSSKDVYYKDFTADETITDTSTGSVTHETSTSTSIISDFTDVIVSHINGTITTGASYTGTFEIGETLNFSIGGTAILAYTDSTTAPTTMTLANMTGTEPGATDSITGLSSGATAECDSTMTDTNTQAYNFTLQPSGNYSVFIEGGNIFNAARNLTDIYAYLQFYLRDGQNVAARVIYTSNGSTITQVAAEEYIKAATGYSATKAAPFGTLAGGVFFGAQAVWVQGMHTDDNNNLKLTDSTPTLREPLTSINLTISNTRADDRIAVYLESGTTELPSKTQYASHASTNTLSASAVNCVNGITFPNDTPLTGSVIMVDDSASEEHRYTYSSFNNASGTGSDDGQLVLTTELTGVSSGGTSTTIIDTGDPFATVSIGDIIRNVTDGGWSYVTTVTDSNNLIVTLNSQGNAWGATKSWEINSLVVLYTSSDTFFVPYMDFIEDTGDDSTPGTQTVTVTYVSDREVIIEARNVRNSSYEIVPFKTTGSITNTGLTQSVIRTEDTVYE